MIAWLHALRSYERHISAAAMAGGFGLDSITYGRVSFAPGRADHPVTQTLLIVYLAIAAGSIVFLHYLEAHEDWQSTSVAKLRAYLPALTQFMFGSLWSAFLVFYAHSGVLAASWPFFVLLAAIFVGNEVFKAYHARLIFTATLFFFALLSYAIFMVPVFTHTIGRLTFLLSGAAAVMVFVLFLRLLNGLSVARLGELKWKMAFGACAVYAAVTGLYFLDVLPPLPLALQNTGVFHSIQRVDGDYRAVGEPQSWLTYLGVPPVVHVEPGKPVYVFSAVFAPIRLTTTVIHKWQHYDGDRAEWRTVQRVKFSIIGGRGKGYRGYTRKTSPQAGLWRVDIDLEDGRLIGRTEFTVVDEAATSTSTTILE